MERNTMKIRTRMLALVLVFAVPGLDVKNLLPVTAQELPGVARSGLTVFGIGAAVLFFGAFTGGRRRKSFRRAKPAFLHGKKQLRRWRQTAISRRWRAKRFPLTRWCSERFPLMNLHLTRRRSHGRRRQKAGRRFTARA